MHHQWPQYGTWPRQLEKKLKYVIREEGFASLGWRDTLLGKGYSRAHRDKTQDAGPVSLNLGPGLSDKRPEKTEVVEIKEKQTRQTKKIPYESTGPLDHRYYVDGSEDRGDYPSLQANLLLNLLHRSYGAPSDEQNRIDAIWREAEAAEAAAKRGGGLGKQSPDLGQVSAGSSLSSFRSSSAASAARQRPPAPCPHHSVHCPEYRKAEHRSAEKAKASSICERHGNSSAPRSEMALRNSGRKYSSTANLMHAESPQQSSLKAQKAYRSTHLLSPTIPDPDYDSGKDSDSRESDGKESSAWESDKNDPASRRLWRTSDDRRRRNSSSLERYDSDRKQKYDSDRRSSEEKEVEKVGERRRLRKEVKRKEGKGEEEAEEKTRRRPIKAQERRESSSSGTSSSRIARGGEPDLWQNARRYRGGSGSPRPSGKIPTKTLKEALKHRPPVSAYVREITRASEMDRLREMERRRMEREAAEPAEVGGEDEAKKIYKEILEVVAANSPSPIQTAKGRMVGYGEDNVVQRQNSRSGAEKPEKWREAETEGRNGTSQLNLARIRVAEDRESITTSLDSYPFAPTSPWSHGMPSRYNRFGYPVFPEKQFGLPPPSGPVSFSGFSPTSPGSQLTSLSSLSSSLHPGSAQNQHSLLRKRKKKGLLRFFF